MNPALSVSFSLRHLALAVGLFASTLSASSAWAEAALILSRGPDETAVREVSLEELSALPQTEIVSETEWSDGAATYKGPLVRDVLKLFDLDKVDTLRFLAANDYYVDIPTQDFNDYDVVLAMSVNGKPLSRRDKGPLWVMYPLNDHSELQENIYLSRMIWQVVKIESLKR